jgi:phage FluMu protein Com
MEVRYQTTKVMPGVKFIDSECPNCEQHNEFYISGQYFEHPVICKYCDMKYMVEELA